MDAIRIQVTSNEVKERDGIDKRGIAYKSRSQSAYAHIGLEFPGPVVLRLEDDQAAYAPGDYTIAGECFSLGDYGSLKIGRIKLVPLNAARAVAAPPAAAPAGFGTMKPGEKAA